MDELDFYFYTNLLLGFNLPCIGCNNSVSDAAEDLYVGITEKYFGRMKLIPLSVHRGKKRKYVV